MRTPGGRAGWVLLAAALAALGCRRCSPSGGRDGGADAAASPAMEDASVARRHSLALPGLLSLARRTDDGLELFVSPANAFSEGKVDLASGELSVVRPKPGAAEPIWEVAVALDPDELPPELSRWVGQRVVLYRGAQRACAGTVTRLTLWNMVGGSDVPPWGERAPSEADFRDAAREGAVLARVDPDERQHCGDVSWGRWEILPDPEIGQVPPEGDPLARRALEAFRALPEYARVQRDFEAAMADSVSTAATEQPDEAIGDDEEDGEEAGDSAIPASAAADAGTVRLAGGADPQPAAPDAGAAPAWDTVGGAAPKVQIFRHPQNGHALATVIAQTGGCSSPGGQLAVVFEVLPGAGGPRLVPHLLATDSYAGILAAVDADGDGELELIDDLSAFQHVGDQYWSTQEFPAPYVSGC